VAIEVTSRRLTNGACAAGGAFVIDARWTAWTDVPPPPFTTLGTSCVCDTGWPISGRAWLTIGGAVSTSTVSPGAGVATDRWTPLVGMAAGTSVTWRLASGCGAEAAVFLVGSGAPMPSRGRTLLRWTDGDCRPGAGSPDVVSGVASRTLPTAICPSTGAAVSAAGTGRWAGSGSEIAVVASAPSTLERWTGGVVSVGVESVGSIAVSPDSSPGSPPEGGWATGCSISGDREAALSTGGRSMATVRLRVSGSCVAGRGVGAASEVFRSLFFVTDRCVSTGSTVLSWASGFPGRSIVDVVLAGGLGVAWGDGASAADRWTEAARSTPWLGGVSSPVRRVGGAGALFDFGSGPLPGATRCVGGEGSF